MTKSIRRRPVDAIFDGVVLQKAADGNKIAIKEVCRDAAEHVKAMAAWCRPEIDDLTPYVVSALERIGAGMSPNEAFRWPRKRGPQPLALELRNWAIRCGVQRIMKDRGLGLGAACVAYALDNERPGLPSSDAIEKHICKGLTAETDLPVPDDVFPLPPKEAQRGPGWE